MEEKKIKKINVVNEDKLEEVAGGRAYNEKWVCPQCGYVIYLTHRNANFEISDHLYTHGWVGYGVDYD